MYIAQYFKKWRESDYKIGTVKINITWKRFIFKIHPENKSGRLAPDLFLLFKKNYIKKVNVRC